MNILGRCLTASMLALITSTSAPMAEELRGAPGLPSAHPAHSHGYVPFNEFLQEETDGRYSIRIMGPEVVGLAQMKDALQTQVAQIGTLLPLYFPADFANVGIPGELALSGRNPQAMTAAMAEYMVTCDPCQEEFQRFGVVYLGSGSTAIYHLLLTKPVESLADLRGLRVRVGGGPWARWATHFGAVPVSIPANDTFEALSQGTIDGSIASYADLLSFRIIDIVKFINAADLGTFHATSNFSTTLAAWDALSPNDRAAFARAANRASAVMTNRWANETTALATVAAEEAGISIIQPTEEMRAAFEEFARADVTTVATNAHDDLGILTAEEDTERFIQLVEKWEGLLSGIEDDPVAIAALVQVEVWDKVDFTTYGMGN